MLGLRVDEARVLLEDLVALRPRGVLQLEHGLRVDGAGFLLKVLVALRPRGVLQFERVWGVEGVVPPSAAPLVPAPLPQRAMGGLFRTVEVREAVPGRDLLREHVEPDTAEL